MEQPKSTSKDYKSKNSQGYRCSVCPYIRDMCRYKDNYIYIYICTQQLNIEGLQCSCLLCSTAVMLYPTLDLQTST